MKKLNEFKGDFDSGEVPEPVDTKDAHSLRPADQDKGEKEIPTLNPEITKTNMISYITKNLAAMNANSVKTYYNSMKESIETEVEEDTLISESTKDLFSEFDLDEDLKTKASVIFESVISAKLAEETSRLAEQNEAVLKEALDEMKASFEEDISKYIDYVAEEFIKDHEVELTHNLKVEMADSFLSGLKTLFEDHFVEISDDSADIVTSLTNKVAELEEALNDEIDNNKALKDEINEHVKFEVFMDIAEGLATSQIEKLQTLAENVDFEDVEDYKKKINVLRESLFTKTGTKDSTLNEEVHIETKVPDLAGPMKSYVEALNLIK